MVDLPDLTLTDALAIWGAITGSVVLVDRLREPPSLVLRSNRTIYGHEHKLDMTAINQGRRPVVIMDAGIALRVEAARGRATGRLPMRASCARAARAG